MQALEHIARPSIPEQKVAMESYNALAAVIEQIQSQEPEIEIEETKEKIKIPLKALKLLGKIMQAMSQGKPVSIAPVAAEMTTQSAAEMLGCSRPHLVKLLEGGKIEFTKVGRHRRIKIEDVFKYKQEMKKAQKQHIIDIMNADEETGLYDT
jgi:excisionase family DNA binding protein